LRGKQFDSHNRQQGPVQSQDLSDSEISGCGITVGEKRYHADTKQIIGDFYPGLPILGICLGHQILAEFFGGEVREAEVGEYADSTIFVDDEDQILKGFGPSFDAWVSHRDEVKTLPKGFKKLAHSETCEIEAMAHLKLPLFGVQFHPEVEHTPKGPLLFRNFLEQI
jgi:GMP synthase (glutamine-hydrolysing) A subunit